MEFLKQRLRLRVLYNASKKPGKCELGARTRGARVAPASRGLQWSPVVSRGLPLAPGKTLKKHWFYICFKKVLKKRNGFIYDFLS